MRFREKLVARGIAAAVGGLGAAMSAAGLAGGIYLLATGEPAGGVVLLGLLAPVGALLAGLGTWAASRASS